MSGSLIYEAAFFRGGPDGDTNATFTRWPGSPEPALTRGELISFGFGSNIPEWRVTDVRPHPDGSETYDLVPA